MSELVKRLREFTPCCGLHCEGWGKRETPDECTKAADYIDALETENKALRERSSNDGWKPLPAPSLDRVFVAGVQPRSGSCVAYWWVHEDVTDENGVPMDYPTAIRWRPIPNPPDENCEAAARALLAKEAGE